MEDVTIWRYSNDLVLAIKGTDAQIRVGSHFYNDGRELYAINQVRFADGTVWDATQIRSLVQASTAGDDQLIGYQGSDSLSGGVAMTPSTAKVETIYSMAVRARIACMVKPAMTCCSVVPKTISCTVEKAMTV